MRTARSLPRQQRGALLILLVIALGVLAVTLFVGMLSSSAIQNERDKKTAAALAEAKAALIGFAVGVDLTTTSQRPGDLPCPDLNNDGVAETSCGNANGSTGQNLRIGRLPWKTLGLTDLRDGDGERLWYAVSNNFKNNSRTTCTSQGQPGCLNSDSKGTITIRDSNGQIIYDGSASTGAVAVVISPGAVLQRQGAANIQDRGCTIGTNCDTTEKCTTSPASLTPKCNPVNYLDIGNGEDNADFVDGDPNNGFINGIIRDPIDKEKIIVNDKLITISYADIMPLLEKRVAKEIYHCLTDYAQEPQNNSRYPWAASLVASANSTPDYSDVSGELFGRIPESLAHTMTDSNGIMNDVWTPSCNIKTNTGSWWFNWRELVFYGLADAYKPTFPMVTPACGSCLQVAPFSTADKQFVAIVAGKILGTQQRTTSVQRSDQANYLEGTNASMSNSYLQQKPTPNFNDLVLFR